MAGGGTDVDTGRKRRLPVWMSAVSKDDELRHSSEHDEVDKQKQSHPPRPPRTKRKVSEKEIPQEKIIVDSNKRKRTRRLSKIDEAVSKNNEGPSTSYCGSTIAGRQKKTTRRNAQNEKQGVEKVSKLDTGTGSECNEELGNFSTLDESENDIELTVEDLRSIAEECINADKKDKSEIIQEGFSSEGAYSSSFISYKSDLKEFSEVADVALETSKCTLAKSSISSVETEKMGKASPKYESIPIDSGKTGDAAQDMLNLFLGPLLKKSEPKVLNYDDTKAKGIPSVSRPFKHISDEASWRMEKKKSSLKDKVAMLLE